MTEILNSNINNYGIGKVILFTNARDEKNLKEWVAHHLLLGFDLIYIFDHKSKIPLTGQFSKFNKTAQRVVVERCEMDVKIKYKLITKAAKLSNELAAEWFLYLDADEFLVINDDKIKSVKHLLSFYKHAHSLSCNWLLFGTNFHVKTPDGLIIDNYIRSEENLNEHIKTFIRPNQFVSPNPHRSDIKNPNKAYHFNGTQLNKIFPVYKQNKHYINPILFENAKVFIAHYVVQSEETYINRKVKLPTDDEGQFRPRDSIMSVPITETNNIHTIFNNKINTIVRDKYSDNIKQFLNSINETFNIHCGFNDKINTLVKDKYAQKIKDFLNTTQNIYGIYFIYCINNYLEVIEEQLSILDKGLLKVTTKLILFITKYNKDDTSLNNLLTKFNKYNNFILVTTPENLYEKFAINNYKQYINDLEYYMYYFHTKGVKPKNDPLLHILSSRRKLLNYYTLDKYIINIQLLDLYDAVGCSLNLYPKKHFSGNFWWSKSTYLNTLSNINDNYLSPEMYILSNNNCKYISLSNDTNDVLFENYYFRNNETILKNITSSCRNNIEHKYLISKC